MPGGSQAGVNLFRNSTGNLLQSQGSLVQSAVNGMVLLHAISNEK